MTLQAILQAAQTKLTEITTNDPQITGGLFIRIKDRKPWLILEIKIPNTHPLTKTPPKVTPFREKLSVKHPSTVADAIGKLIQFERRPAMQSFKPIDKRYPHDQQHFELEHRLDYPHHLTEEEHAEILRKAKEPKPEQRTIHRIQIKPEKRK